MDAARRAGRTLVAALPGPEMDATSETALRDLSPAGVILFARNLRSPVQTLDLVAAVREVAALPLFVSIDQEGGAVNRLARLDERFLRLPPARVQARWSEDRVEKTWEHVGRALAALDIDVDFAPVVDLDESEGANGIGPRSFGGDPGHVAALAAACLRGLRSADVEGCLKHFPGLGGSDLDTHEALAVSDLPLGVLRDVHLEPYRRLAAEASFVMTAHAHYPEIDGAAPLPGTFSGRIVRDLLRDEIGYGGLVISDDLEMGAVTTGRSPAERALAALDAGCDLALFCHGLDAPRRARDGIAEALEVGALDPAGPSASHSRLASLLARRGTGAARARGVDPYALAVDLLERELA